MALSRNIRITFNNDLNIDDYFVIKGAYSNLMGGITDVNFMETWKSIRSAAWQVTTGIPTASPGERTAINYMQALMLDANAYNFTFSRSGNKVTIVSEISPVFGWSGFLVGEHSGSLNTYTDVTVEYFDAVPTPISIESLTFSTASSPCTHVLIEVETSELATKITSPVSINPNTDNPFSFEWLRGTTFPLTLENVDGNVMNELVETPALLNSSNFTFQINNSPYGATVIVNSTNSDGLELEYSLNGSDWQTSNIFSGLPADNYTLYVKDQYGCSFIKTFFVSQFGIQTPYFEISKSNSIRFAERITWGDSENYKTDENTLSNEVDVPLPTTEIQRFQSANIITTQFKSNYATNIAKVLKCDDTEVNIPVIKKSNNIGLKDKRDARKINLGGGKTGVYFVSGNIYDYVTNAVIDTYALNGLIPEWAQIGNYISIGSIFYLIEDIVFDESRNADVIVFTDTYSGAEVNVIVGSIYNRFNYEIYEFTIDMNAYINHKFRVRLNSTDPNFTEIIHLSEILWCKVKHEKVLEIKYKNSTNTDIFYSTGIEHLILIPYIAIRGKSEGSSEVHKTDTDAILLSADLYEANEIQFQPVTREIWRKLMLAFTHEELYVNGVRCVRNGDFNTEGPLGDTDDYVLTVSVLKRGPVYNSQTSGNLDFDGSAVEVPGLIETDNGFVKY